MHDASSLFVHLKEKVKFPLNHLFLKSFKAFTLLLIKYTVDEGKFIFDDLFFIFKHFDVLFEIL